MRKFHTEEFDPDDELHNELQRMNKDFGKGEIISLVYEVIDNDIDGIAVCKKDYGLSSFAYSVEVRKRGTYVLACHKRKRSIGFCDYFDRRTESA